MHRTDPVFEDLINIISFFNGNYGYNVYIFLPEYVNSEFLNILLDRENFIKHVYYLLLHPVISSHLISLK